LIVSAIPPNPIASILQSGPAQAEHARETDAARNASTDRSRGVGAGPDAILEVESTDADTQVHTDSGGLGSQGRYDASPDEETATELEIDEGVTTDAAGHSHVDLSA
jgi:hypothetical protein